MSVLELEPEFETSTSSPWLRKLRNMALALRIGGMIYQPLPMPALPVEPTPIVRTDERTKKGGAGSSGSGSREAELMNHLGRLAATCRDDAEAEAYVGALPTLAARCAPGAAAPLLASAPRLSRALSDATRYLRAHPATRRAVASLPAATRNAALRLERHARAGRPVTPDTCARMLAEEAVRSVLSRR